MSSIHVLDQSTINMIAAGEVIERPMAVIKELVENAVDAKANMITVEIKDGGIALMRVTDNGTGIAKEDIKLAFTPHATSKITTAEDLLSVSSLGFRGEALASIAAVSQLELLTKTKGALTGMRYANDGGTEKALEETGCPEGSTFLVHNLFYNTPARLKFLKSAPTEASYIGNLMERMALSHPEIAFRFMNQNQNKLTTSGNGNLKETIYKIYGRDITANLLEVNTEEVMCKIAGFIGKPIVSRGNRACMNYFINGRYIKSKVIQKAIEEAYAPYSMQHRYPFTVLHFTIDSKYIDVNVHPQKMELRFTKEREMFQSVYHAISKALSKREYIPEVHLSTKENKATSTTAMHVTGNTISGNQSSNAKGLVKKAENTSARAPESFEKKRIAKEEAEKKHELTQAVLKEVSKPIPIEKETLDKSINPPVKEATSQKVSLPENNLLEQNIPAHDMVNETASYDSEEINEAAKAAAAIDATQVEQTTFQSVGILSKKAEREYRIIGQAFSTYWIIEYENTLYMVDQHAAHEKVLYERFMKEVSERKAMTQYLQPPIIITLTSEEEQVVKEQGEIFSELGYEIEPFGGREYAVSGIPAHLPNVNVKALLSEVLSNLIDNYGKSSSEIIKDKIATMSCKAAVKGGQKLPELEARALLKELMTLENPFHCPHGRPTMISMTKKEIEKKFKRIV